MPAPRFCLALEADPDAQYQCAPGYLQIKHDAQWEHDPHSFISELNGEAFASVRVAQPPEYAAGPT